MLRQRECAFIELTNRQGFRSMKFSSWLAKHPGKTVYRGIIRTPTFAVQKKDDNNNDECKCKCKFVYMYTACRLISS